MSREIWQQEREELQAVLDDIDAGRIRLDRGMDDYVAGLRRQIALIENELGQAAA